MKTDYRVIDSTNNILDFQLGEIWVNRTVIYSLLIRQIKMRYTRSLLGPIWIIIPTIMTTIIFTIIFHQIAKINTEGIPYPIFALTGIIFWNLFVAIVSLSTHSILSNKGIILKRSFPRVMIPIYSSLIAIVDFFINLIILFILMLILGFIPSIQIIFFLPIFIGLTLLTGLGIGLILSILNVFINDISKGLNYIFRIAIYFTPIAYPSSSVPKYLADIINLNPMSGIIENSRNLIIGNNVVNLAFLEIAFPISILVFIVGYFIFRRSEYYIIDMM